MEQNMLHLILTMWTVSSWKSQVPWRPDPFIARWHTPHLDLPGWEDMGSSCELFWLFEGRKHGVEFLLYHSSLREAGQPTGWWLYFRSVGVSGLRWEMGSLSTGFVLLFSLLTHSSSLSESRDIQLPGVLPKAEQSALRLRIYPPPSLGDVPGRGGNWLTKSLTLWKDKYMKKRLD